MNYEAGTEVEFSLDAGSAPVFLLETFPPVGGSQVRLCSLEVVEVMQLRLSESESGSEWQSFITHQVDSGLPCLLHGTRTKNSSKSSSDLLFDDGAVVEFSGGYCSAGAPLNKMVLKVILFTKNGTISFKLGEL